MDQRLRIVHYINQFFGGVGGEDKAGIRPQLRPGPVGPGSILQDVVKSWGDVRSTIICGDNYFVEHSENAAREILELVPPRSADIFIAGPAFSAGRYGLSCGELCKVIEEQLGIPTVTGMFPEQPGVSVYRKDVFIVRTESTPIGMPAAMRKMASLVLKLYKHETIGTPHEEGYIPRGIRRNVMQETYASERAIDMLLAKSKGLQYNSEVLLPKFQSIARAEAIKNLRDATIALVTTGGIVPKGNPDKLKSHVSMSYGKYKIDGPETLAAGKYEANHGGYYTAFVNQSPDRMLPIDVLSEMANEGVIGRVFPHFYSTAGTGTYPEIAEQMARQIFTEIKRDGADGVILTST